MIELLRGTLKSLIKGLLLPYRQLRSAIEAERSERKPRPRGRFHI